MSQIGAKQIPTQWVPYDKEIQYLESNGNQYIDTKYYLKSDDIIISKLSPVRNVCNGQEYFGYGFDDGVAGMGYTVSFCTKYGWTQEFMFMDTYVTSNGIPFTFEQFYNVKLNVKTGNMYVNDECIQNSSEKMRDHVAKLSMYLFSCHRYLATSSLPPHEEAFRKSAMRLSNFKIINSNEKTCLDMIPVRIGNCGYMYDRVSGQMFGNLGSGNFQLGPDI